MKKVRVTLNCQKTVISEVDFVLHAIILYVIQVILTTPDNWAGGIKCPVFAAL